MKFCLKIAQETVDVDVSSLDGKQDTEFTIGEEIYHVRYKAISDSCLHLVVDEKSTEVFVVRGEQEKHIFINGQTFSVQDDDQFPSRPARRRGIEQAPGDVTPPMPSVVVRIMVKEGDLVKQGQGLIVVTAMKMETTLKAPNNGRVIKINTTVDAKVAPGDILVEIEKEEKSQ